MNRLPLVVGVGLATADLTQVVDHLPSSDQKIWAHSASLDFGGPAANAVAAAVACGCRGRLIAPVGRLGFGPLITQSLEHSGIELIDLAARDYAPPISSVLVTAATGQRAVVSTNARWAATKLPVTEGMLTGAAALIVDGHLMGHQHAAARLARRLGIPVVQDAGSWKPGGVPYLTSLSDLVVASADFTVPELGSDATGQAVLDWLAGRGAGWVARSQGAGPIQVRWSSGEIAELPVEPVSKVVDTLGAGDA
ncbi:MAG: PfkB family carbohydrate kinase, partial [Bifidobacteriaceae bacterium]|nr:PfkB family carbohydrate kinase [Bifidobacteriaceae bacterium]